MFNKLCIKDPKSAVIYGQFLCVLLKDCVILQNYIRDFVLMGYALLNTFHRDVSNYTL